MLHFIFPAFVVGALIRDWSQEQKAKGRPAGSNFGADGIDGLVWDSPPPVYGPESPPITPQVIDLGEQTFSASDYSTATLHGPERAPLSRVAEAEADLGVAARTLRAALLKRNPGERIYVRAVDTPSPHLLVTRYHDRAFVTPDQTANRLLEAYVILTSGPEALEGGLFPLHRAPGRAWQQGSPSMPRTWAGHPVVVMVRDGSPLNNEFINSVSALLLGGRYVDRAPRFGADGLV